MKTDTRTRHTRKWRLILRSTLLFTFTTTKGGLGFEVGEVACSHESSWQSSALFGLQKMSWQRNFVFFCVFLHDLLDSLENQEEKHRITQYEKTFASTCITYSSLWGNGHFVRCLAVLKSKGGHIDFNNEPITDYSSGHLRTSFWMDRSHLAWMSVLHSSRWLLMTAIMSAVLPSLSRLSSFAPCSINTWAISSEPATAAAKTGNLLMKTWETNYEMWSLIVQLRRSGVQPAWSVELIAHPSLIIHLITSTLLLSTAQCMAVEPPLSTRS